VWRRPTGRTRPSFVNYCCWGEGGGKQGNQTLRVQPKLPRRQTNISQCMPFIYAIYNFFFPALAFPLCRMMIRELWYVGGVASLWQARNKTHRISHTTNHIHTLTHITYSLLDDVYILFFSPAGGFPLCRMMIRELWYVGGVVSLRQARNKTHHISHTTHHIHTSFHAQR
jgi:hypothetical protein